MKGRTWSNYIYKLSLYIYKLSFMNRLVLYLPALFNVFFFVQEIWQGCISLLCTMESIRWQKRQIFPPNLIMDSTILENIKGNVQLLYLHDDNPSFIARCNHQIKVSEIHTFAIKKKHLYGLIWTKWYCDNSSLLWLNDYQYLPSKYARRP